MSSDAREEREWGRRLEDWWAGVAAGSLEQRVAKVIPLLEALEPQWKSAWAETHKRWSATGGGGSARAAREDHESANRALEALQRWTRRTMECTSAMDAVSAAHADFYPRSLHISGDIHQVARDRQAHVWYFCGFLATALALVVGQDDGSDSGDFLGFVSTFVEAESNSPELVSVLSNALGPAPRSV